MSTNSRPLKPWEINQTPQSASKPVDAVSTPATTQSIPVFSQPLQQSSIQSAPTTPGNVRASIGSSSGLWQTPASIPPTTMTTQPNINVPANLPQVNTAPSPLTSAQQIDLLDSQKKLATMQGTFNSLNRYSQALQIGLQAFYTLTSQILNLVQSITMFKMELLSLLNIPLLFTPIKHVIILLIRFINKILSLSTFGLISIPIPLSSSSPSQFHHPNGHMYNNNNISLQQSSYLNNNINNLDNIWNSTQSLPSSHPASHFGQQPHLSSSTMMSSPGISGISSLQYPSSNRSSSISSSLSYLLSLLFRCAAIAVPSFVIYRIYKATQRQQQQPQSQQQHKKDKYNDKHSKRS